jgi:hypothetical protein
MVGVRQRLTLENAYMAALLVAPAAFLVGALAAYTAGSLRQTGGFLLLTLMVGALSLHFWRDV